jgi:hypothetical protein
MGSERGDEYKRPCSLGEGTGSKESDYSEAPHRATASRLVPTHQADFCDVSYGYRPGRSPHHALPALREQIRLGWVNHVFEANIRGYFNHVCHSWLQKMMRKRIADPVILSLIGKWLKAGVTQEGEFSGRRASAATLVHDSNIQRSRPWTSNNITRSSSSSADTSRAPVACRATG